MSVLHLPDGPWWDWDLLEYDGAHLRFAAGSDLTYHHGLELLFTDVAYLACPTQFSDPTFREPTSDERETLRGYVGQEPPVVVAFDVAAEFGEGSLPCVIAAESVEVVVGVVYRYWREDLNDGERLAPFVRPPGRRDF